MSVIMSSVDVVKKAMVTWVTMDAFPLFTLFSLSIY